MRKFNYQTIGAADARSEIKNGHITRDGYPFAQGFGVANSWQAKAWREGFDEVRDVHFAQQPEQVKAWAVVQEGGATGEWYVHLFDTERDAIKYRASASRGAYRTSAPIGLLDDSQTEIDALQRDAENGDIEVSYPEDD